MNVVTELKKYSLLYADESDLPTIEHVFTPTLTVGFDTNILTFGSDIDGFVNYIIYETGETPATTIEELDAGLPIQIAVVESTPETVDLSGEIAGTYTVVAYAENEYDDNSELVTLAIEVV